MILAGSVQQSQVWGGTTALFSAKVHELQHQADRFGQGVSSVGRIILACPLMHVEQALLIAAQCPDTIAAGSFASRTTK